MKEITITEKSSGQRLNKYLERLLRNAGSGFLYKMLRKKNITLNGGKADGKEILCAGDVVRIFFSDDTFAKFTEIPGQELPCLDPARIVYEDEHVLIYDKPAGLLSQKAKADDLSAGEYLLGYLRAKPGWDEGSLAEYRPSAVNRLDRNTTGLLLFAKSLKAAQELSAMLKDRSLKKEYLCLVKGKVTEGADLTDSWEKDRVTNTVVLKTAEEGTVRVETSYTPVRFYDTLNATLLRVELKTGKTHQIRAQLANAGLPIAGDRRYGDDAWNDEWRNRYGIRHHLLHAWQLVFPETDGACRALSGRTIRVEPPFRYLYEEP